MAASEKQKLWQRNKYASDPEFKIKKNTDSFRNKIKRKFGLSWDDYENKILNQQNRCAICESTENGYKKTDKFCLDHCHITGKSRDLLCYPCNKGLGHFMDNPALLRKAAEYLERHQNV
jgi:hypothetical protein